MIPFQRPIEECRTFKSEQVEKLIWRSRKNGGQGPGSFIRELLPKYSRYDGPMAFLGLEAPPIFHYNW